MLPDHHLPDDLLLAYVKGELDAGWELIIATHLALCPACRKGERRFEVAGGTLLDEISPEPLGDGAADRALRKIEAAPPTPVTNKAPVRPTQSSNARTFPQPLYDSIGCDIDHVKWSLLGGGAGQHIIRGDVLPKARLLRIPPSSTVPEHSHSGLEMTLVLDGSFHDAGIEFRRGDIQVVDESVHHQPIAGSDRDCICLAVTDAPLKFHGILPRLAQRFLRI